MSKEQKFTIAGRNNEMNFNRISFGVFRAFTLTIVTRSRLEILSRDFMRYNDIKFIRFL